MGAPPALAVHVDPVVVRREAADGTDALRPAIEAVERVIDRLVRGEPERQRRADRRRPE